MPTGPGSEEAMTVDPVCGRRLAAGDQAVVHLRFRDRPWHFCGEACRDQFLRLAARTHAVELARRGALLRPGERVTWGRA